MICDYCDIERDDSFDELVIEKGFFSKKTIYTCYWCRAPLYTKYNKKKYQEEVGIALPHPEEFYLPILETFAISIKDFKDKEKLRNVIKESAQKAQMEKEEREKRVAKKREEEEARINALKKSIIQLLKDKPIKMPTSDIDAYLKYQNVDKIKTICEEMYQDGEISFAGNGRYFVLTEGQEKPKKTSAPKSESTDIPHQIKKLSDLKDQGILTEEEFQSKKKDLLDKM